MEKNIKQKHLEQLEEYSFKVTQYVMPGGGDKNPIHPFKKLPKILSDDEEFMIECIEIDNGESFKLASKRLKKDKGFVLEALQYSNTNYDDLNPKLKCDSDVIKEAQANDFKYFGKEILNDKNTIYEIFKNSYNKEFKSYKLIPNRIRSDINFFLKLLSIPNQTSIQLSCSGRCLLWATNKVINNNKIINTALKREPSSLKYLSKTTQSDKKILDYVLKKAGFLPKNIEKKLLKKKSFIMKKIKYDYGHIYDDLEDKFKNDKDIAFAAFKINPDINYNCLPKKFKDDPKFLIRVVNSLKKDDSEIYEDICEDLNRFKHLEIVKKPLNKIKNLMKNI